MEKSMKQTKEQKETALREEARALREIIDRETAALANTAGNSVASPAGPAPDTHHAYPSQPSGNPGQLQEENFTPETSKEKEIETEIQNMPEEDKEKLGWGLSTIGFKVEEKKNKFFAAIFDPKTDKMMSRIDKKSTAGRFLAELRDSFVRDAEEARKKGLDVQNGKNKAKFKNASLLVGNTLKYGRIVADLTGASIANPFRYAMMGGMVTARAAEAGKEARFKSDALLEKTQIKDANLAAEEAWKIYEKAGGVIGDQEQGIGGSGVSVEALENAYLMEMPKNIQERLKDPSVALNFTQKILRKQIEFSLVGLETDLSWVGYSRFKKTAEGYNLKILSDEQIEIEKQKLLKKWERKLNDYDRMITQYGTVDQLAMAARYAETTGKAIVLAMQVETAYKSIMNVPKLWEHLSHLFSSHNDIHETLTQHGAEKTLSHNPSNTSHLQDSQNQSAPETSHTTSTETPAPDHTQPSAEHVNNEPATQEVTRPASDMLVHKGEGIEHTFIRQIENNPKLAQELGFKGDIDDAKALHAFAGHEAHVIALKTGYVSHDGTEQVGITAPDKLGFKIETDGQGHFTVLEKDVDGKVIGKFDEGYKFGKNPDNQYEKVFETPKTHDVHAITTEAEVEHPKEFFEPKPGMQITGEEHWENMRPVNTDQTVDHPLEHNSIADAQHKAEILRAEIEHRINENVAKPPAQNIAEVRDNIKVQTPNMDHLPSQVSSERIPLGPDFERNPLNLGGRELFEVYQTHNSNMHRIIPENTRDIWATLNKNMVTTKSIYKSIGNRKITGQDTYGRLVSYLRRLQEVSGLKPQKGNWLQRTETLEHYTARALQKAEKIGKLDQVKLQ